MSSRQPDAGEVLLFAVFWGITAGPVAALLVIWALSYLFGGPFAR